MQSSSQDHYHDKDQEKKKKMFFVSSVWAAVKSKKLRPHSVQSL